MKLKLTQSILAAVLILGSPALVLGQATTKPVGFQSVTVKASAFNLVGINFLKASVVVGVLEGVTVNSATDNDVDFATALSGLSNLVIEITNNTGAGAWANVSAPVGGQVTLDTDLVALGAAAGDSYQIFALPTIAEVFGATNSAGLKSGNTTTADIIWLSKSDGSGGFDKYYYAAASPPFITAGWKSASTGNTNQAGTAIYHNESMIIERRETTDLTLTFAGTVKTTPTLIPVFTGFNFIERSFPVLSTLGNSSLSNYLGAGTSTTADVVWIPNASGGYDKFYFATAVPPFITAGWKGVSTGNADASATPLASGIIIERKGGNTNVKITPDAALSSL